MDDKTAKKFIKQMAKEKEEELALEPITDEPEGEF
jgi:hypothetical protein